MMDSVLTLEWIARLTGVLAIIQGIEFIRMKPKVLSVWKWRDLQSDLGFIWKPILRDESFVAFNILRSLIGVAIIAFPCAILVWLLFAFHIATLLRWLGTFNGGSDYMSLLVLWTCALGLSQTTELGDVCLYYLTFQLCFSYFRAGWIKLKNPRWRNGTALPSFLGSPIYARSRLTDFVIEVPTAAKFLSWIVIVFEVSFPVALLHHNIALGFMCAAAVFHLCNAYIFGLNRFVFAWIAAYPALFYVSQIH